MKTIFVVYDEISETFVSVFFAANTRDAIRAVKLGFAKRTAVEVDGFILTTPEKGEQEQVVPAINDRGDIVNYGRLTEILGLGEQA